MRIIHQGRSLMHLRIRWGVSRPKNYTAHHPETDCCRRGGPQALGMGSLEALPKGLSCCLWSRDSDCSPAR